MEHLPCDRHFDKSCPQGAHSPVGQHTQIGILAIERDKCCDSTFSSSLSPHLPFLLWWRYAHNAYQSQRRVPTQFGGWGQGAYPTEDNANQFLNDSFPRENIMANRKQGDIRHSSPQQCIWHLIEGQ